MKRGNRIWHNLIFFLVGVLVCYFLLQFEFLKINTEVNIPDLIMSVGTAIIGLYIANTIQKRLTKNQNQYSYLKDKFDTTWASFNSYSQQFIFNDYIEVSKVAKQTKDILHSISFLKNIYMTYELNDHCVCNLEKGIEDFEQQLMVFPIANNIITYNSDMEAIQSKILSINKCFSSILKEINNL